MPEKSIIKTIYWDTLKTIIVIAVVTACSYFSSELFIERSNVALVYALAILIITVITNGYVYGIIASVMSVFGVNFFFTRPYFEINFTLAGYPVTFAAMLFTSLISSTLVTIIKRHASTSVEREKRTEALYEVTKMLLKIDTVAEIRNMTMKYINKLSNHSVIMFMGNPNISDVYIYPTDKNFIVSDEKRERALEAYNQKLALKSKYEETSKIQEIYLPILYMERIFGVIIIYSDDNFDLEENKTFIKIFMNQVAIAFERQNLTDEKNRIIIAAEKEKMRSNLLRAVSHDLRTPLTSISGASSVLLENKNIDKVTHDKLVTDIKENAQWLIRMVENLLSVTRISEEGTTLLKSLEAVEEVVGEAVRQVKKRFPERKIYVKVPLELIMVPMDGTLIEQVIINIIENSIKHSGNDSDINIEITKQSQNAVFEISDDGNGISDEDMPNLFNGYIKSKGQSTDSTRGMGIGLSICRSIIDAHGGTIMAENKKQGGAVFRFTLPIEEELYEQ